MIKRSAALLLALVISAGLARPTEALEINVKGNFHFQFRWADNLTLSDLERNEADTFLARERVRLQIDFVASENLKGVLYLHSNNIVWGDGDNSSGTKGGALDTNQNHLTVRLAYIDWKVPDSGLSLRLGLQNVSNPSFVPGPMFISDSMAGVTLSNKFNDNLSASLGWYRLSDNNGGDPDRNYTKDAFDMFLLMLPLSYDSLRLTPWGEFSLVGRDATLGDRLNATRFLGNGREKKGRMWHAGLSASLDPTASLNLSGDFIYGGFKAGGEDPETSGFYAALRAAYDLGNGKLAGTVWYASGNDDSDVRHADYSTMPSLVGTDQGDPGAMFTSLGFWGNQPLGGGGNLAQTAVGTWGAVLAWENFSFLEDLSHTFRLAWYRGTHDKNLRDDEGKWKYRGSVNGVAYNNNAFLFKDNIMLTDKDNVFEINLDSKYQIAKGFSCTVDMGYLFIDWQRKYQDYYNLEENMWRVGLGFQYEF